MAGDRWLVMIEERLKELENQIAPLEAERVALTKAREAYLAAMGKQPSTRSSTGRPPNATSLPTRRTKRGARSGGRRRRPLADEVADVLRDAGEPLHTSEILTRLTAKGVAVTGQRPATNIAATLFRNPRFINTGGNVWALAEVPTPDQEPPPTPPSSPEGVAESGPADL